MKKKRDVRFGSRFFMALIGIFLYAPIVLLIVFSFNAGNSNTVWKGFSRCIIPRQGTKDLVIPDGMQVLRARNIREAIEAAL